MALRFAACLFGFALTLGCGSESDDDRPSECEAHCRAVTFCGPNSIGLEPDECPFFCTQVDDLNRKSGCGEEFGTMASCIEDIDACDPAQAQACTAASNTWVDCTTAFCTANPDVSEC